MKLIIGKFARPDKTTFTAGTKMEAMSPVQAINKLALDNPDALLISHRIVDTDDLNPETYKAQGFETLADYESAKVIGVTAAEFYGFEYGFEDDVSIPQVTAHMPSGEVSITPPNMITSDMGDDYDGDGVVSLDEIGEADPTPAAEEEREPQTKPPSRRRKK